MALREAPVILSEATLIPHRRCGMPPRRGLSHIEDVGCHPGEGLRSNRKNLNYIPSYFTGMYFSPVAKSVISGSSLVFAKRAPFLPASSPRRFSAAWS